ncbi:LPXTG cell wall anchor domain-containing protein [Euryarchaeota archaeon]|nr:LPXTG cell wall anchor domain-containing protein [Euryarchaeota archaeon]
MRNGSIQPDDVQVSQNDSIGFNNVVMDLERTVTLENPSNSTHNWSCTASPYNSSGTDDECWLWLDPLNWSAGNYNVIVYSNGTIWQNVNITIVIDAHNETTPTFVLPGGNIGQDTSVENNSMDFLWVGILLFAGAFFLRTKNKGIASSSEDDSKVSK